VEGECKAETEPHLNHFGEDENRNGQDKGNPEPLPESFYVVAVVVRRVARVVSMVGSMVVMPRVGVMSMSFVEVLSLGFMALIGLVSMEGVVGVVHMILVGRAFWMVIVVVLGLLVMGIVLPHFLSPLLNCLTYYTPKKPGTPYSFPKENGGK
jgi:hypothetical protein